MGLEIEGGIWPFAVEIAIFSSVFREKESFILTELTTKLFVSTFGGLATRKVKWKRCFLLILVWFWGFLVGFVWGFLILPCFFTITSNSV